MRVIIAGGRDVTDPALVERAMAEAAQAGIVPTVVLSGAARGVDAMGEAWARARGIPVERYPADWARLGKAAGPRRNAVMADQGDALVAVWDGKSRGTGDMVGRARAKGLKVHVLTVKE